MGIFERISLGTESLTNALHTNDLVSNNERSDIDKVELGTRATGGDCADTRLFAK